MTHYTANSKFSVEFLKSQTTLTLTLQSDVQSLSKRGKELCINGLTNNQNPRKSLKSSQNLANSNKREQLNFKQFIIIIIDYSEF